MRMGGRPVAVLEYLDPDNQRVRTAGRQSGEITAYEVGTPARGVGGELGEGGSGDVQAGQVEAPGHQRQIVAAVAAADVQATRHPGRPGGSQDVPGESHRRLAAYRPARYSASQAAATASCSLTGRAPPLALRGFSGGGLGPGQHGQRWPLPAPPPDLRFVDIARRQHGVGAHDEVEHVGQAVGA